MKEKTMAKISAPVQDLTYEQALAELETVLASLESESRDLQGTLARFERGRALIARCQELLESAELKVRQLAADGEVSDLEHQD